MGFSTKAKREQKNKEGWKKALTIRKSSAQKRKINQQVKIWSKKRRKKKTKQNLNQRKTQRMHMLRNQYQNLISGSTYFPISHFFYLFFFGGGAHIYYT